MKLNRRAAALEEGGAAPPLPPVDESAYEEKGWEHWQSLNELRLIGSFLLNPSWSYSKKMVSPLHFHDELHRHIFFKISGQRDEAESLMAEFPIIAYAIELATVFHLAKDLVPSTFERDLAIARRARGLNYG